MDEKTRQQVREAISDHEAMHPHWRQEQRDRMIAEAQQAEARAQKAVQARQQEQQELRQRVDANNSKAWCDWVDQRIAAHIEAEQKPLVAAMGQTISEERQRHRNEIKAAVAEATRALEAKLKRLEDKLMAQPGQLPMAKFWYPETVFYRGEIVSCEGQTFQAKKDTASRPPGPDWFLVARAGRDAIMPHVRGTFRTDQEYKSLDICALDGAAFIARKDNPGICPGPGWQLLTRQGRPGRKGEKGDSGPRGEKGEPGPAVMPKIVSTKIEGYNLVVLREDKSLEIFDLRPMFENYHVESGREQS